MLFRLHNGDCLEWLRSIQDNSWDFMSTDPPYGLGTPPDMTEVLSFWLSGREWEAKGYGFMGRSWDAFVPGPSIWRECIRVMKPGSHGLVCAGTRTVDVMGIALRMAGFEIRDMIAWLFGSGMPKSCKIQGWPGTGLKPALEPVLLVRKPLEKGLSLRKNAEKWGVGGLNIDACRIECSRADFEVWQAQVEQIRRRGGTRDGSWKNSSDLSGANPANPLGKWPPNVAMDEDAGGQLDLFVGPRRGMSGGGKHRDGYDGSMLGGHDCELKRPPGNGGPSRFFYCAKASKKDREGGLDGMPILSGGELTMRKDGSMAMKNGRTGAGRTGGRRNSHPMVKPESLERWKVRLISLPGHRGGDPFMGSGSTGVACALEGREFDGCELNDSSAEPFFTIARKRIDYAWARACALDDKYAAKIR